MTEAEEDAYGTVSARYYDAGYGTRADLGADASFYGELARASGGPVLELGCGTGRALLPIAADGIACTGLDASAAMLASLRAKGPPAHLRLLHAPMQRFELPGERFALVFSAFRAFQHLDAVEDQLACLRLVRRHLAPGGMLAFDVFNPRLERIAQREEPEAEDLRFALEGDEVVRYVSLRRDPARQRQAVRFRYERRRGGAVVSDDVVELGMRWFFRYELEHLLARAGFEQVEILGDFDRSPLRADSPAFVVLAR